MVTPNYGLFTDLSTRVLASTEARQDAPTIEAG